MPYTFKMNRITGLALPSLFLVSLMMVVACSDSSDGRPAPGSTQSATVPQENTVDGRDGDLAQEEPDQAGACPDGEVSPGESWEFMQSGRDDITMIDIRRENEYGEEHVPGAIHIGIMEDDFHRQISELPRDSTYLIICWYGSTSRGTVHNMKNQGFQSVCSVQGGYKTWRANGLPLEK